MSPTAQALLAELDTTLPETSDSWRSTALRQIVDLFVSGAETYSDEQVALFGKVMGRLIPNADRLQLAELSNFLAPAATRRPRSSGFHARHMDIAVCGPILEQVTTLPDADLAEIADNDRTGMNILTKIAARPQLGEAATDVLLKRSNRDIQRTVIDNPNARVSESGFARVILGLDGDKGLAAAIAARQDVPAELRPWLDESRCQ